MRKKIVSIIATALLATLQLAAGDINYGYYLGDPSLLATWGTEKAEDCNVAMRIQEPALVGGRITAINIPVNINAKNTGNYEAFLTKQLTVKSGKIVPDICSVAFSADSTFVRVVLPEPYTIDQEQFFVGYSLKVNSIVDPNDRVPFILTRSEGSDSTLLIVSSRTYRKVTDMSKSLGASCAITIEVEGDFPAHNIATAVSPLTVGVGQAGQTRAKLTNNGTATIDDIDYSISVNGQTVEGHLSNLGALLSNAFYGQKTLVSLDVPAIDAAGTYEASFCITKVNGEAYEAPAVTFPVNVMNLVPVKRPLFEEYTGTWCGFCPSGWVAMNLMNEWHPEFVCASYHNDDAMEITTRYPNNVDAFPNAYMDRWLNTDPFAGETRKAMGIELTWQQFCEMPTMANVAVEAAIDTKGENIDISADYTFCYDIEDGNFGVCYMITADSLCGFGQRWLQHSYYYQYSGEAYGGYMDQFCDGQPEYQFLAYNDVVIAQNNSSAQTDKLPAKAKEGETFTRTHSFKLADMNNTRGENLVQDKHKLHAIAVLMNLATGKVENCAKCDVIVLQEDGITELTSDAAATASRFDLSGRRINEPQQGLSIERLSNGSSRKVMIR